MSKGWRARKRARYCAEFRAARWCRTRLVDRRQRGLFDAPPSFCAILVHGALVEADGAAGCAGRVWCEVLAPWERREVRRVLQELREAATGE